MRLGLHFWDYFFLVFHTSLILFNLTGWIIKSLRPYHLWSISLTFLSWIGLGAFYGWGYCPLTDWHWQILLQLGETALPASYISYLFNRFTGIRVADDLVDLLTGVFALLAWLISIGLNRRLILKTLQVAVKQLVSLFKLF